MSYDTLSEDVLPGTEPDAAAAGAERDTSKEPVSREELIATQRMILDLSKKLDQGLASNRQSATDVIRSEVSKAQKSQNDFLVERLAALLPKDGPSLDAIRREAYLDEQMHRSSQSSEPHNASDVGAQTPPASGASLMKVEIASILKETGLKGDEPELKEFITQNKGKRWFEVGSQYYDLALKIAARNRGSAGGIVPGGGLHQPDGNLKAAYLAEVAAMRKRGDYGLHRWTALKDRFRAQGLQDVDTIDISSAR